MTPEDVARFPLPGSSSPINLAFSPDDSVVSYLHADGGQMTRQLWGVDLATLTKRKLLHPPNAGDTEDNLSLEEKLRRERQRIHSVGVTSYFWSGRNSPTMRIMVPLQGNIYVQEGLDATTLRMIYSKAFHGDSVGEGGVKGGGCIDPQLSPDGSMVAFVRDGELYVSPVVAPKADPPPPVRVTFGAGNGVSHGLADFLAQEEMDRFKGFWWSQDSKMIAYTRVDESHIPPYVIMHQGKDVVSEATQEVHHYPFAGAENPKVRLATVAINKDSVLAGATSGHFTPPEPVWMDIESGPGGDDYYLARVNWLHDGSLCAQVENREQTILQLLRLNSATGESTVLVEEKSDVWINLHHLLCFLPHPVSASGTSVVSPTSATTAGMGMSNGDVTDSNGTVSGPSQLANGVSEAPIHESAASSSVSTEKENSGDTSSAEATAMDVSTSDGTFSFLWASERTGFMHLYLYTYTAGDSSATLIRQLTSGEWIAESVVAVDQTAGVAYVMGTYDSPCERHLYAVSLTGEPFGGSGAIQTDKNAAGVPAPPVRLTSQSGMHNVIMDHKMTRFVDVYSTTERPAIMAVYQLAPNKIDPPILIQELHSAIDERVIALRDKLRPAEFLTTRSRDNAVDLYIALYRPDPAVYGNGPYPTIVGVYGGPHVQRVSRCWLTTVDMRAQRFRDLGFAVLRCDNRGSYRRGLAFEGWLKHNMGGVEVRDQEDAVRYLVQEGITDPTRVGIYGWSYGGYLVAMCMCKAPGTFRVGVSGAPVTSWDGYDTHYTERYMGTPEDNATGYHESSVLTHASKLQGKLMLVHGLLDENVHFRHTARLINSLIAARKPYDLLVFPDERHSPRKLQDRVYMEQRISDYFLLNLMAYRPVDMPLVSQPSHL